MTFENELWKNELWSHAESLVRIKDSKRLQNLSIRLRKYILAIEYMEAAAQKEDPETLITLARSKFYTQIE